MHSQRENFILKLTHCGAFQREDVDYLHQVDEGQYFPYDSRTRDVSKRIDYILESINKYQDVDFSPYDDVIICLRASSEYPVTEAEKEKLLAGLPERLKAIPIKIGLAESNSYQNRLRHERDDEEGSGNDAVFKRYQIKRMLKDHCEYSSWLVRMIEGDIKDSWMYDLSDEAKDKCLLSIRKNLIDEMVLSHQEDYIEIIKEFNDCLKDALKEMYDRAHRIYQDAIKHQDDGEKIEVTASLYLGKDYPALHPVQEGNRQQLWKALCDGNWNVAYDGGISQLILPQGAYADSFEAFIGMNDSSSNMIEDFNPELTKDLNLTNQFLHLYRHTDFALTDFIFVRDFYSEINVSITKGLQDDE